MTRTIVLSLLACASITSAFAQRHGGGNGGFHGGRSGGSFHGGGGFPRGAGSFHGGGFSGGGGSFHRGGFRGDGFRPRSFGDRERFGGGYRSHGAYGGDRPGRFDAHGYGDRPLRSGYGRRPSIHVYDRVGSSHLAYRAYRPAEWRRHYPNWREHYYYHGGRYYYDTAYRYPATVDNEWGTIAALSGGAALLGAFNHDPYLTFGGTLGALYSLNRYESDLHSGDRQRRLRAVYFSRPDFWRGGHRYERVTVTSGGHRYYRFRRY